MWLFSAIYSFNFRAGTKPKSNFLKALKSSSHFIKSEGIIFSLKMSQAQNMSTFEYFIVLLCKSEYNKLLTI